MVRFRRILLIHHSDRKRWEFPGSQDTAKNASPMSIMYQHPRRL